ncbi:MAG: domain S-box protein [Mucilaginibacter sp.]|uniref:PAS domain-containing protein n=1 Tax=Mucilaginibacter sp. TaxID=1882438 RepID=UPI00260E4974|nr:PAS domain-containing protein [Mucilaginibacter sp.]MDB5002108.1 domain S-box protein [Mucilaginibacter sp.]
MNNFFSTPDKERQYQSYMVFMLTIIWSVVTGVIVSVGFYFFPEIWLRWLTFLGVSLFIAAINLSLNYFGYTRVASLTLTIMLWLYITIPCYSAGGMMAPGIISQMSVILTAGFLLGWRGGMVFGLLSVTTDFGFAYLEMTGHLPQPSVIHNPITRWIGAIIPFGTILSLQYYATNHLRAGLIALQKEIGKREEAENAKDEILHSLEERVKELKTLYEVSRILQDESALRGNLFQEIVNVLPSGWQYPGITAARICVDGIEYATKNYKPSGYRIQGETKTTKDTLITIEVMYLQSTPQMDEGPFLKEERSLINMLLEMLKIDLERKERTTELRDYKFALDIASIVAISGTDGCFTFVNDNFAKASKYNAAELLNKPHSIIWSDYHSPGYFDELAVAMQNGKPFRGEFCNRAKDGNLYWVDTAIVPFLDEHGQVYQYLSINQDITERKEAEEKIRESEQILRRITSHIPCNSYMFEIEENGRSNMIFMNRGTEGFNHNYIIQDLSDDPQKIREILHEDDKMKFNLAMKEAFRTQSMLSLQYRVVINGYTRWRWFQAVPESNKDGKIVWYGATSDITPLVDYIASIEQIIFDISHVIRRPISTMLGLTKIITDSDLTENEIKDYSQKLYLICKEMDDFIYELDRSYNEKKDNNKIDIDFSSSIDKRNSLFS